MCLLWDIFKPIGLYVGALLPDFTNSYRKIVSLTEKNLPWQQIPVPIMFLFLSFHLFPWNALLLHRCRIVFSSFLFGSCFQPFYCVVVVSQFHCLHSAMIIVAIDWKFHFVFPFTFNISPIEVWLISVIICSTYPFPHFSILLDPVFEQQSLQQGIAEKNCY